MIFEHGIFWHIKEWVIFWIEDVVNVVAPDVDVVAETLIRMQCRTVPNAWRRVAEQ